MPAMYCPRCGRDVELETEVRFCRYCGFSLVDTKDTLRGYTEIKRQGHTFINVSYLLLLALFWIQYFRLIPWDSIWGGAFFLISVVGFIFGLWFMGNWVVDKPAKYVKPKAVADPQQLTAVEGQARQLHSSRITPISAVGEELRTAEILDRASATEETTRALKDHRSIE